MDDYRTPCDPAFRLDRLSRRGLAVLAREYQLTGHLLDRAAMPQVRLRWGSAAMREIAIAEWMAASPVYTRRIQRTLGFSGGDVATIFKGMQFDVGAPHGFLDFNFRLLDDGSGEFWLPYCGALMDVEPMGEKHVIGMCHQIEDPTFDATAGATNPRAQVRPIHRPPRAPADRVPHCHWRVRIEPDAEPVAESPLTHRVRASRLAGLDTAMPPLAGADPGGLADYGGAFDPELELEDLSQPALLATCREFCIQSHLLVRSLMLAVAERWGEEAAREVAARQWIGLAGIAAERIVAAMGIEGDDLDAVAKLLQLHPAFHPRDYVDFRVERRDDELVCWIGECAAFDEPDGHSWFVLVDAEPPPALDAIVRTVNPRARCRPREVPGARAAWSVAIDPAAEPSAEPVEVGITRLSKGSTFHYVPRRTPG